MAQRIMGFLQTRKQYMQFSSLIAISVILHLAIIVFLNNSLGWFASGNTVTASNITITVADDSDFSVLGFTVYKNKYDRAASLNLTGTDEEIYKSAVTELENGENKDYLFITEQNGSITEKQTAFETDSLTMDEGGAIYILIDYYPNVIQSKDIAFDGENETTQYEGDISSIEVIKE